MNPVVVFLVDSLQTGGAEQSLLEILKGFQEFRPVVVVAFRGRMDLEPAFQEAGISVVRLDLSRSRKFRELARHAAPVIRELQPALIHSTLFYSDMLARRLRPLLQVPLVNSIVNDTYGARRYRMEPWLVRLKLFMLQMLDARTASKVDRFIANSETIAASAIRAVHISPERVTVIPRGRHAEPFDRMEASAVDELKLTLGTQNRLMFLSVGRLITRKGHRELIEAFAKFSSAHPDAVLALAGDGPERQRLEALTIDLGLRGRVLFLGNRTDVPMLMKSADFLLFPSLYEGLPGVLLEAMLAKLPIIASDTPENRECVDDAMALFFKPGDVVMMAAKMEEALKCSDWHARVDRARTRALERFNPEQISRAYEKVYRELISHHTNEATVR